MPLHRRLLFFLRERRHTAMPFSLGSLNSFERHSGVAAFPILVVDHRQSVASQSLGRKYWS